MKQAMQPMRLISGILIVLMLAGCFGSTPASVEGLKQAAGDSLPGARGLARDDQVKIDRTVARLCAAGVYTKKKCAEHTKASADRFEALKAKRNGKE